PAVFVWSSCTGAQALHSVPTRRSADLEADHAVQAEIVRRITERHPDHAIIAEEFLAHDPARPALENARYCWVIDPIDGTLNFARDRKSTRLNSSHAKISYAVFCMEKKD